MPAKWEVELKFEVRDKQALLQQLAELGFESAGTEQHCDIYFRHPARDFRVTDEAFRLRRLDSKAYVTYKGPRRAAKVKTRPEIELVIQEEELDSWRDMLERLGFFALPVVEKQRHVFKPSSSDSNRAGFTVTIDEVLQLGTFAEVELIVDHEPLLGASQSRVAELGKELGLDHEQPRSYLSQLLEKLGVD